MARIVRPAASFLSRATSWRRERLQAVAPRFRRSPLCCSETPPLTAALRTIRAAVQKRAWHFGDAKFGTGLRDKAGISQHADTGWADPRTVQYQSDTVLVWRGGGPEGVAPRCRKRGSRGSQALPLSARRAWRSRRYCFGLAEHGERGWRQPRAHGARGVCVVLCATQLSDGSGGYAGETRVIACAFS